MSQIKKHIIMLVCCLAFFTAVADDSGNNPPVTENKRIVLVPIKTPSKRPTAPSHVYIECVYTDNYLEFIFPEGVTSLSVFLSNDDNSLMDVASLESPIVYIPILYGEYGITCTTEDGREFYGKLYF